MNEYIEALKQDIKELKKDFEWEAEYLKYCKKKVADAEASLKYTYHMLTFNEKELERLLDAQ